MSLKFFLLSCKTKNLILISNIIVVYIIDYPPLRQNININNDLHKFGTILIN